MFKRYKEVQKAYIAHYYYPEQDERADTLVALVITGGLEKIILDAEIILDSGAKIPDPPVDFIQLSGKGGIESYFSKDVKPFYESKRFGIF
ncbi:MAG: enhanced serine sensitivity protein SseB C-terminal domain-containing protein [Anaerolineaceae bacterium]|nr:enhanced serine sensitivity protein SseB C-terminal domain-containing protein [Anaerolineaceae bacterium]